MKNEPEISILIPSYNSKWPALRDTIYSVLQQQSVQFEIIICDDGSVSSWFDELEDYFRENAFEDYVLARVPENVGTCRSIMNGLGYAKGQYVKLIAPGDLLAFDDTLSGWLKFTKEQEAVLSFGDVICYAEKDGRNTVLPVFRSPQNIDIYSKQHYSQRKIMLNYIFLRDAVWGCDFISATEPFRKYLEILTSIDEVRYAEDMAYRMMIINGEKIVRYSRIVVWYEYGEGISTGKANKWKQIIDRENELINRYMLRHNSLHGLAKTRFSLGMRSFLSRRLQFLKYLVYPELVYWKLKKYRIKAYTPESI